MYKILKKYKKYFIGGALIVSTLIAIDDLLALWGRLFPSSPIENIKFASPNEELVLIIPFSIPSNVADHKIHIGIEDYLKKYTKKEKINVRIETTESITNKDVTRDYAKQLANELGANVVIWGKDTGIRVEANILDLNIRALTYKYLVTLRNDKQNAYTSPSEYSDYVIVELPKQIVHYSLFMIGEDYYLQGKLEKSIPLIEASITALDNSIQPDGLGTALYRLGLAYLKLSNIEKAVEIFNKYLVLHPTDIDVISNIVISQLNMHAYKPAEELARKLVALFPKHASAHKVHGLALFKTGNHLLALESLNEAIRLIETNTNQEKYKEKIPSYLSDIYLNRGIVNFNIGRETNIRKNEHFVQAEKDVSKAIKISPNLQPAYRLLGALQLSSGKFPEAIKSLTFATILDPSDKIAKDNLAIAEGYLK